MEFSFCCKDETDDELYPVDLLNTEPIISLKIHDRKYYKKSIKRRIADPPEDTEDVRVSGMRVRKIKISKKRVNKCDKDLYDAEITYGFEYTLHFLDKNNQTIGCEKAKSVFRLPVSLRRPPCPQYTIHTDLFNKTLICKPFILVKAFAVPLEPVVNLYKPAGALHVTIGLITEVSLFRITNMLVKSDGLVNILTP